MSYEVACKALKQDFGGTLHIHANVRSNSSDPKTDWKKWCDTTEFEIRQILGVDVWTTKQVHLEPVKSFAPRVHHLVLDLQCIPNKKTSHGNKNDTQFFSTRHLKFVKFLSRHLDN